jgi:hypothetical protein
MSYAYLFIAVASLVVAGICALVNQPFGIKMLIVPLISGAALIGNIVVWALIRFAIDSVSEHYEEKEAEQKKIEKTRKK